MKKQLVITALLSALALNSWAGNIDRAAVAEDIKQATAFSADIDKARSELKAIQFSDPELFETRSTELKEKQQSFDMASVVYSAIELIDQDASGQVGFDALNLIVKGFNAVFARGDKPEEGKLSWPQVQGVLKGAVNKALDHHINNDKLFDVVGLPLALCYKGYEEKKSVLQRVLNENSSHAVRGEAAFELASHAIAYSKSTRAPKEDVQQASMDMPVYSELAMEKYPDVKVWKGTVKERLEGKLFSMNSLAPGKVLPNVEANNLEGKLDQLTNYRGNVVLIDFWATWCGPCKAALPGIATLKDELAGQPFKVISISVDDEIDSVLGYQQNEQPMPWVNWHIGPDSKILTKWAVGGFPTYYLLDSEGVIHNSGHHLDEAMENQLRELVMKASK